MREQELTIKISRIKTKNGNERKRGKESVNATGGILIKTTGPKKGSACGRLAAYRTVQRNCLGQKKPGNCLTIVMARGDFGTGHKIFNVTPGGKKKKRRKGQGSLEGGENVNRRPRGLLGGGGI